MTFIIWSLGFFNNLKFSTSSRQLPARLNSGAEATSDNDFSLTPGRYVGVEEQAEHGFDYKSEMKTIKSELKTLNAEANDLADQIQTNLDELGL